MHSNFGQIWLFTSELLALSIFPIFSHISHRVQWKTTKIKNKDDYKKIFMEMIQHPMPFHKIAKKKKKKNEKKKKHRTDFEYLAILLHLELTFMVP